MIGVKRANGGIAAAALVGMLAAGCGGADHPVADQQRNTPAPTLSASASGPLSPSLSSAPSGSPTPAPSPTPIRPEPAVKWTILTAKVPRVNVYSAIGGRVVRTLDSPNRYGAKLVLLALQTAPGWWQAQLPVRPNGTLGWVHAADVTALWTTYRIDVFEHAHRLEVRHNGGLVMRETIAVGKSDAPTPGGRYYVTMLLQPTNPKGPYGPYAFGLSEFSDVYHSFGIGLGEIGIHGTDEPWLLGQDVSHGCIRMSNDGITRLVHKVPVGVPVFVHA